MLLPVPLDRPTVGTPVGLVDPSGLLSLGSKTAARTSGKVLSYDGRQPLIDGQPVPHAEIAEPLWEAIDAAARRLFGPREWSSDMSAVSGMNSRSMMKGRVLTHGLPPAILSLLGRASSGRSPRSLGYLMLAIAYSWDEALKDAERDGVPELMPASIGRLSPESRDLLQERLDTLMAKAMELVGEMQADSAAARARRETKD